MSKILIIGQAPPAQEQKVPYDTTMLYEWLEECGISKEQAQEMFEFEAVSANFPGKAKGGGHKVPSTADMLLHYHQVLSEKILNSKKIIVLGNVAKHFLENDTPSWRSRTQPILYLMHPSRMNYERYHSNRNKILDPLREFLK
jgi:uracil-DNA glycosylase